MKNLKIGYLSWGRSPAEFRRFARFAQHENLNAELFCEGSRYDIIVVTQNSDLSYWLRLPKSNCKIIFDFIDSYLSIEPYGFKRNLRGLVKFINGEHRFLDLAYHQSLEMMMRRADAVVCSTPEQKELYLRFNDNVHDVLDVNDNQIRVQKADYHLGDRVHIAWEGMGGNAWTFREIAPVLREINRQRPIALHLVTDLTYKPYNGPFAWNCSVKPELKSILGDIPFYLYEWNPTMLSQICVACDIALLPIPQKPNIYWAKPENRLLMLWRMGLPVLASATPAYARCMDRAGVDGACRDLDDWGDKLTQLLASVDTRRDNALKGADYANRQVSKETLIQKWYRVLESVL